jgi:hypothetical protein
MPSIAIFTFDPQRFEEIIKIRQKEQADRCEKTSILGEWCDAKNGRVIRLVQDGDISEILAAYRMWCDLGTMEIFPVADTNDLINQ